jgi:hypothetical protein
MKRLGRTDNIREKIISEIQGRITTLWLLTQIRDKKTRDAISEIQNQLIIIKNEQRARYEGSHSVN